MTECSFCDTEMLNVKLEMLVEKAGINGLEVGIGFNGLFYAFLIDAETMRTVRITDPRPGIGGVLALLTAQLDELLAQFPERV